jgi:hypothetical protein
MESWDFHLSSTKCFLSTSLDAIYICKYSEKWIEKLPRFKWKSYYDFLFWTCYSLKLRKLNNKFSAQQIQKIERNTCYWDHNSIWYLVTVKQHKNFVFTSTWVNASPCSPTRVEKHFDFIVMFFDFVKNLIFGMRKAKNGKHFLIR